jgi:hypothetical protein
MSVAAQLPGNKKPIINQSSIWARFGHGRKSAFESNSPQMAAEQH